MGRHSRKHKVVRWRVEPAVDNAGRLEAPMTKKHEPIKLEENPFKGKKINWLDDIDLDEEEVYLRDGRRLTEALAEQIAAEALANARAKNLMPGRKSLSGDGKHSPVVNVRIPEGLKDQLDKRAAAEGKTVSKITREAIIQYLAS